MACSLRPSTYGRRGSVPASTAVDLGLQQRLAETRDVAVAEDAEAAGEELAALTVALDVLVGRGTEWWPARR